MRVDERASHTITQAGEGEREGQGNGRGEGDINAHCLRTETFTKGHIEKKVHLIAASLN